MRCIVVDDEKLALELMEDNVRKLPNLKPWSFYGRARLILFFWISRCPAYQVFSF
jgi:hypothetical protein